MLLVSSLDASISSHGRCDLFSNKDFNCIEASCSFSQAYSQSITVPVDQRSVVDEKASQGRSHVFYHMKIKIRFPYSDQYLASVSDLTSIFCLGSFVTQTDPAGKLFAIDGSETTSTFGCDQVQPSVFCRSMARKH